MFVSGSRAGYQYPTITSALPNIIEVWWFSKKHWDDITRRRRNGHVEIIPISLKVLKFPVSLVH
jgi:hypothetical protein